MEPTKMDNLFKKAVDEQEGQAQLSSDKLDELFGMVQSKKRRNGILFWKVACIILLFSTVGVTYAFLNVKNLYKEMSIKLTNTEQELALSERNQPKTVDIEPKNVQPEVKREVVVQKVVEYVDREKIVYEKVVVPVVDHEAIDSLKNEIALRNMKIRKLEETSVDKETDKDQKIGANPTEVAFQQQNKTNLSDENREGKVKFQLSIFNLQKP